MSNNPVFLLGTKACISEDDFMKIALMQGVMRYHSVSDHNDLVLHYGFCPLCMNGSEAVPDIILEKTREESL